MREEKGGNTIIKVNDDGVHFKSYRDGRKLFLSPEISVQAQKDLGADIILPLDELLPFHADPTYFHQSSQRTYVWEKRSLDYHLKILEFSPCTESFMGTFPDQRKLGCKFVEDLPFDGSAIGGSLGKNLQDIVEVVGVTAANLSAERPRHLLGIGDLPSIWATVGFGIDSFDSSYPTKAARHGMILTSQGPLKLIINGTLLT